MAKVKGRGTRAAIRFRPGDVVVVERRLPHADARTPRPGELCVVTGVDRRRGNKHPVHVRSLAEPGREDWFADCHLALYEDRPKLEVVK